MKWRNITVIHSFVLTEFERKFNFTIHKDFRAFLLEHNGGIPSPGIFPTTVRERKIARLLDFSDKFSSNGAWEINKRLREQIGPKRIVVGIDSTGNFICLERYYKRQQIVVWSHISGDFEECLLDIPAFLRTIS